MQEISSSCSSISESEGAFIIRACSIARRGFLYVSSGLSGLPGKIQKSLFLSRSVSLISNHEVAIMYFGRTSEFLVMTSERTVIPAGRYRLGQLLCSLRKRGGRWADELDNSHLMCSVNGRGVSLLDTIKAGDEIYISSKKSIFEA